jgi:hypothetical protein
MASIYLLFQKLLEVACMKLLNYILVAASTELWSWFGSGLPFINDIFNKNVFKLNL